MTCDLPENFETPPLILEKLARTSTGPGVYLMKGDTGEILYVGKAKNLKRRLSSYFQRTDRHPVKTGVLIRKIVDFDIILTESENEALLLESTLIKQHRPRYNVILKDDKQYPFLRLDTSQTYPKFSVVRKASRDGALYFGPFSSSGSVRESLALVNKTFRLRTCKDNSLKTRHRPCLNFQMDRCLGVCCNDVEPELYAKNLKQAILVLQGKTPVLIRQLRQEMKDAAEKELFELAAEIRDKLMALETTMEKQVVVANDLMNRDILGRAEVPGMGIFTLLRVRSGLLSDTRHFVFHETLSDPEEQVASFLRQYYMDLTDFPQEVLVSEEPEDLALIMEEIGKLAGRKIAVFKPRRGEKVKLLDWANSNAQKELEERMAVRKNDHKLLERLAERLGMSKIPARIECFDNANISGKNPVTGMVVFTDGKPDKSQYRKYKIRHVPEQDDYAYMDETLRRRFRPEKEDFPLPDLLLVDGGKGQLNIAVEVLQDLGCFGKFSVAAIAKMDTEKGEEIDKIFLPFRMNPVNFGKDFEPLYLLMRVRDEAHRTATTFHKKQRIKTGLKSRLDEAPGIGPKLKAALISHFGSFKKLQDAGIADIAEVPGFSMKKAASLHAFLHSIEIAETIKSG
ncbi:excinuclease ABC subunit UvrC [Desulfococcaceae bacterium OttesenSCG-928-F15]|nr:excinuclease ABC subunit UvrC [Desulfococcaceae bacterium OttesenSCG-928-F15]